jgi:cytosine deaminase
VTERPALVLRGGRVASGDGPPVAADIAVGAGGLITRLGPRLPGRGAEEVDLGGRLVVPGLVDLHQHLDKSRTVRRVPNPDGTLAGAVRGYARYAAAASREEIAARARRTAEACLARGTTAIRSHVNVELETGLRALEALVDVRAQLRGRLRLQLVAFLTSSGATAGLLRSRELGKAALDAGADALGCATVFAPDPEGLIDACFDLAIRRDRPLDFHVDETLDPRHRHVAHIIRRTRERGFEGRVVASHCASLGALPLAEAGPIVEGLAAARIGVVTLPAANLFLLGREAPALVPRGVTRVADLLAAGVDLACASDNIQDPFVPVGSGDLLETARWTVLAGQLDPAALPAAFRMISTTPGRLMGRDGGGLREGGPADLLITDAGDVEDLVMSGPLERAVVVGGGLVAGRWPSRGET